MFFLIFNASRVNVQVTCPAITIIINRHLGYERVYLPLCEVADTPLHIQYKYVSALVKSQTMAPY